ncbi:Flp family type IVb pilin [bacterium]|nr:Flp family type IVb pilin [bacterium]
MFTSDEEGQGMAEYGLILALVSIAVLVTLGLLGTQLNTKFQEVVTALGGGG